MYHDPMDNLNNNIILSTFNCRGIKSSIPEVHQQFYSRGITAMNNDTHVLKGRPFGGLAILWRNTLGQ